MWAIRILTGPQAGLVIPLQEGKNTFGRGSTCEVKIASNSVSKEHATCLVIGDKVIMSDLNSRNGTYVNGIRIQNQRLNKNDKIALHDVLLEVIETPANQGVSPGTAAGFGRSNVPAMPAWAGSSAIQLQHQNQPYQNDPYSVQMQAFQQQPGQMPAPPPSPPPPTNLLGSIQAYVDNVAMPGIYALAKSMPYRWAIGVLVAIYIVSVTAISIVPIVTMTKKNIQAESIRRAKTIARNIHFGFVSAFRK
ncbi:MAG: FHA domain-containing protein, partial [Bdellovibrionota bacterium]